LYCLNLPFSQFSGGNFVIWHLYQKYWLTKKGKFVSDIPPNRPFCTKPSIRPQLKSVEKERPWTRQILMFLTPLAEVTP